MKDIFRKFVTSKYWKPVNAILIAAVTGVIYVFLITVSGMHAPIFPLWMELLGGAIAGELVMLIAVFVNWVTPKVSAFLTARSSTSVAFAGGVIVALSGFFLTKVGKIFVEGGEQSGAILIVLGWLIGTIGSVIWFVIWFFGKPSDQNKE